MLAWIIYFKAGADYNRKYIDFYIEEGKKLGITVRLILIEDLEFGVSKNQWYLKVHGKKPRYPDFVIFRAMYPLLSRQLEYMGIKVFNNSFVSEICNDKAKTCQYLAKTGIPMIDTAFYLNSRVKDITSKKNEPSVIKAVDGHGGSQVFLLNADRQRSKISDECIDTDKNCTKTDAVNGRTIMAHAKPDTDISHIITGLGSSDVVVQPLTGSRHQDLRVYVIGKEIIAAVLRTSKEGFRSNFSLGGEVCLYQLSGVERELVYKIIPCFDFGLVGIDFIIGDQGELIFNEIEDVVGSRMLYQCSDINIVERYLKHIIYKLQDSIV